MDMSAILEATIIVIVGDVKKIAFEYDINQSNKVQGQNINRSSLMSLKPNHLIWWFFFIENYIENYIKSIGVEALHGGVSLRYTMCVSNCQEEFVLRELSFLYSTKSLFSGQVIILTTSESRLNEKTGKCD